MHDMHGVVPNSIVGIIDNPIQAFDGPDAVAFSEDGTTAYIASYNSNVVSIIDVATNTVIGAVSDQGNSFDGPINIVVYGSGLPHYNLTIS